MMNKLISMEDAVRKYTWNGMTFGHGGALPIGSDCITFFREMVKQGVKDINCISHCSSQGTNLSAAAGVISRMECGFSGLEVYGFANGLGRAVQSGKVILEDYSNGTIPLRLMGGALNLPFVPSVMGTGSDQQWASADDPKNYPNTKKIPEVIDPFTNKTYGALSCIKLDVAVIHVTMADIRGNAIMLGSEWSRFEISRAAKKVVLQADYIIDTDCMKQYPNLVRIPDLVVDAVVYWPLGAWPQASPGAYDNDDDHMYMMNKMFKDDAGTQEYIEKYVNSYNTVEEYLEMLGKDRIDNVTATKTAFLMDPYRKWVKSDSQIKGFMEGR